MDGDLETIIIVDACDERPLRRPLAFDTISGFPTPVDLPVHTADEWRTVSTDADPFARSLTPEVVWVE